MHNRKQSRPSSQSKTIQEESASGNNKSQGKPKQVKEGNEMSSRREWNGLSTRCSPGRKTHGLGSWCWSFLKLTFCIFVFVLAVYIYDENILHKFVEEAGWKNSFQMDHKIKEETQPQVVIPAELELKDTVNIKFDENEMKIKTVDKLKEEKVHEEIGSFKYHILQSLTNTHTKHHLKSRFEECTKSILTRSTVDLHFFFVVDEPSKTFIMETMQKFTDDGIAKSKFQFSFLDIDPLAKKLAPHVNMLQEHVTGHHPQYSDAIFFLSVALHEEILPPYVHRVAMMDTDLKFQTDIRELFDLFNHFEKENIMGIAHEQQPVYRHIFSLYRSKNKGTKVGDPPPEGLTGFNSGVMLIDINKMRDSKLYTKYLDGKQTKTLADKYSFKGHLGDQDFFTILSLDHSELFYVLPCTWNRQLCQWWKDKGYANVFDLYFSCPGPINIYHGNCNTPIPV